MNLGDALRSEVEGFNLVLAHANENFEQRESDCCFVRVASSSLRSLSRLALSFHEAFSKRENMPFEIRVSRGGVARSVLIYCVGGRGAL